LTGMVVIVCLMLFAWGPPGCAVVCEWHCWWYWSLEGGEASRHISDSCLWGFTLM